MNAQQTAASTTQDGKPVYDPLVEIKNVEQGLSKIDLLLDAAEENLDRLTTNAQTFSAPSTEAITDQNQPPTSPAKPDSNGQFLLELKKSLRQARNEVHTQHSSLVQVIGYATARTISEQGVAPSSAQPGLSDKEAIKKEIGKAKEAVSKFSDALSAACDTFMSFFKKPGQENKTAS